MTRLSGESTLGVAPPAGGEAPTGAGHQVRTEEQWRARFTHAIEQRQAALVACFAGPSNVHHRTSVKLAIRGPLHEHEGMPGAYAGWGKAGATLYFGQLPERAGDPPPPDDAFNQCLGEATQGIAFPPDEMHAVDATWIIKYVPQTQQATVL